MLMLAAGYEHRHTGGFYWAGSPIAGGETDLARLSERPVSVLGETMQPASVGLWLRKEGSL